MIRGILMIKQTIIFYLMLILGINILYAKDIDTYCFESPYIFIGVNYKETYLKNIKF